VWSSSQVNPVNFDRRSAPVGPLNDTTSSAMLKLLVRIGWSKLKSTALAGAGYWPTGTCAVTVASGVG
jgi:hypothetical protein